MTGDSLDQIEYCLNCKKKSCNYGHCAGLKDCTAGVHKHSSEELDRLVLKFYPYCESWQDMRDAIKTDKTTLRRHCISLGLDISKFSNRKKKKERTQEK